MNLQINHSDRAHSPFGGSSAKRVMECPGSVKLCQQYPNKSSSFASEGTALHEAIDFIFQGQTKTDDDVVGMTFNDMGITQDMFDDAIAPALGYYDIIDKELGGVDYLNEARVEFKGVEGSFGTVDIIGASEDRSIVLDWKFGRGVPVTAKENAQLMYYAYAAMHSPDTKQFFSPDKPVELFIVQPMVNDGDPFTRWTTSPKQLEAFAADFRRAVKRSTTETGEYNMGAWCKFCNGKPGCPLYQNTATDLVALSQDDLADNLSKYAPLFEKMLEWGKAGQELMHQEMEKGLKVKGYKLVKKRATRRWVDEKKADSFLARNYVSAADRHIKKLVTPPQAEKLLKKAGGRDLPDGLVEAKSSGTTLAKEDDKRPAVTVTAEAFKQLANRLAAS